jgi:tetratricopeptide (TPR) repeat protein
MSECSHKILQEILGTDDPDTLSSMANLASTYWKQGRWGEAEQLDVRVMETRTRVLGAEHPSTLTSMGNLALTYSNQGRWGEAEQLFVRVMETRTRVLGAEHPDTLTSMANLASTYTNQKRWTEAEELLLRAVDAHQRVLGLSHPSTERVVLQLHNLRQARLPQTPSHVSRQDDDPSSRSTRSVTPIPASRKPCVPEHRGSMFVF